MAAAPATIFLVVLCSVGLRTVIDFDKQSLDCPIFFLEGLC
jgi:hypothetical protein